MLPRTGVPSDGLALELRGGGGWRRRIESENNHKNKQNADVDDLDVFLYLICAMFLHLVRVFIKKEKVDGSKNTIL